MLISNFPYKSIVSKTGELSEDHLKYFDQLTKQLQFFLSDLRYKLPAQTDDTIQKLNNKDKNLAGMVYNSSAKSVQVNTDGNFKTICSYEEMNSTDVTNIPSGQRNGRFIYETDSGLLKVGRNNEFKTVTLT